MQGGGASGNRIQTERRPGNSQGFQVSNRSSGLFSPPEESTHASKWATMYQTATRPVDRQFHFHGERQRLDQLNNFRVNPSGRGPVTVRSHNGSIQTLHLWRARRPRSNGAHAIGLGMTAVATADDRLALYCAFVTHRSFYHRSIEGARIASPAGGSKVALFEDLRNDRRSDDPSSRRMC